MYKNTVWDTIHGEDLSDLINQLHHSPNGYHAEHVQIQYLNHEYVVTVIADEDQNDDSNC